MKKVTRNNKETMMGGMRQRFGQSQQWWADYLGVSLAQIKMAESAGRSLPTPAMLKLSAVEIAIAQGELPLQTNDENSAMPGSTESLVHKKLARQSDKLSCQAMVAQHKLEAVQLRYRQACNSQALAALLLKKEALKPEVERDTLVLELLQLYAQKQLKRYSPEAQAYLQWQVDCYTYGAARAQELMT